MVHSIELGSLSWQKDAHGWKCTLAAEDGFELMRVTNEGRDLSRSDWDYDKKLMVIKWTGAQDKRPRHVTAIVERAEVTKKSELSRWWKKIEILIPILKELPLRVWISGAVLVVLSGIGFSYKELKKHLNIFSKPSEKSSSSYPGNLVDSCDIIEWYDNNTRMHAINKNASYELYNDSSKIFHATNKDLWDSCNQIGAGCWCYYGEPHDTCKSYGKLYNHYAAMDSAHGGVVPHGWRLFSMAEVDHFAKNHLQRGGFLLKSKVGWQNRENGSSGAGIDSIGFNGKPYGYCTADFKFEKAGSYTGWWTSGDNSPPYYADYRLFYAWRLDTRTDSVLWFPEQRQYGYYLRFIKDH